MDRPICAVRCAVFLVKRNRQDSVRLAFIGPRTCSGRDQSSQTVDAHSLGQENRKQFLLDRALSPYLPHSAAELANHLADNVIYHARGDLLVLNKPYGVSSLGYTQENGGIYRAKYSRANTEFGGGPSQSQKKDDSITLEDAFPHLRKRFGEPGLHFCLGLKRWASGPVILPCSEAANRRIEHSVYQAHSMGHTKGEKEPAEHMHRAIAICVSTPPKRIGTVIGYGTFQDSIQAKEFIFVEGVANRRQRLGNFAVQGECNYRVLASAHGLSLVDLCFTKFNRHLPRLILSHLGSPIFGDELYERRLVDVDGRPVLIEPMNLLRGGVPYQPMDFLRLVGLKQRKELRPKPPIFLAVYQTQLPFWGDTKGQRNKTEFMARVPPPEHFIALTDLLGFTSALRKFLNSLEEEEGEEYNNEEEGRQKDMQHRAPRIISGGKW